MIRLEIKIKKRSGFGQKEFKEQMLSDHEIPILLLSVRRNTGLTDRRAAKYCLWLFFIIFFLLVLLLLQILAYEEIGGKIFESRLIMNRLSQCGFSLLCFRLNGCAWGYRAGQSAKSL